METLHPSAIPFFLRVLLLMVGVVLLWAAPASVSGLLLMLVGLICAVTGLTLNVSVVR